MEVFDPRNIKARADALSAALELVWEKGKEDGMEHLLAFDRETGETIASADGDKERVQMPEEDFAGVSDGKAIIVHNHPGSCCPLSLPDAMNGLSRRCPIYAIGGDRSVSWIDGKSEDLLLSIVGPSIALYEGGQAFLAVGARLGKDYMDAVQEEARIGSTPDTLHKNGVVAHFANLHLSLSGMMHYFFHFEGEMEARLDAAAKALSAPPCRKQKGWRDVVEVA